MFAEIILQPVDWKPSPPDPGPIELPNGKRRWRRNQVACDTCHARRVRCDMVFSNPCSRCKHKDAECAITRERRKRGRRGRAEQANANQILETLGVHDTPTIQGEARQTETCSVDESPPVSSLTATDPTTRPDTPGIDNIKVGNCSALETPGSCSDTSSSQILEELGMGLTEDCLPTANLFQGLFDLGAEHDLDLPPLPNICTADDITSSPHAGSEVPSESSVPSPPAVDLTSPDLESKSRSDDILYDAEGADNMLLVDLLESTLYGANMPLSLSPTTTTTRIGLGSELFC